MLPCKVTFYPNIENCLTNAVREQPMPRCFRFLAVATVLLMASPAETSASEICDRVFQALSQEETTRRLGNLWGIFSSAEARTGSETSILLDQAEYWVTIDQGTALSPDCNQGLVRSSFYLPGLLVQPLVDLDHDDVLLITEHGLYAVLPQRHLQPVTADTYYIFSDSLFDHKLCVNSPDLNPDCDARLAFNDNVPARLHAIYSYIHGRYRTDVDDRWRLYLRTIHENRLPVQSDELALLCDRFNAGRLFARDKTTTPMPTLDERPGYEMVSMSFCVYKDREPPEKLAVRAGMKVVTLESAKEVFSVAVPTLFLRRSDQILNLSRVVDQYRRAFRNRKECSEDLHISKFQTIGLSGGLSLDALPVIGFGGRFEVETKTKLDRDFTDRMFIISGHIMFPSDLTSVPQFFSKTYDIWSIFSCENNAVTEPVSIVIYHHLLRRDSFVELNPQALRIEYEELYGKRGQPARSTELSYYSDGYIGRYSDYVDFLQWRSHLRSFFENDPKIIDLQWHPDYREKFARNAYLYYQLVDHFVQLTLAATFFSNINLPLRPAAVEGAS